MVGRALKEEEDEDESVRGSLPLTTFAALLEGVHCNLARAFPVWG